MTFDCSKNSEISIGSGMDHNDELDADILVTLADQYMVNLQYEDAELCLRRALDSATKTVGFNRSLIMCVLDRLAVVYRELHKDVEADRLARFQERLLAKLSQSKPLAAVDQIVDAKDTVPMAKPVFGALVPVEAPKPQTVKMTVRIEKVPAAGAVQQEPPQVASQPSILVSQLKKHTAAQATKKPATTLIVQSTGEFLHLGQASIWIGKDSMNDLCLTQDDLIERSHAAISCENNEHYVTNQAKATLTRLNGKVLSAKTKLFSGDILEVGRTKIVVS